MARRGGRSQIIERRTTMAQSLKEQVVEAKKYAEEVASIATEHMDADNDEAAYYSLWDAVYEKAFREQMGL